MLVYRNMKQKEIIILSIPIAFEKLKGHTVQPFNFFFTLIPSQVFQPNMILEEIKYKQIVFYREAARQIGCPLFQFYQISSLLNYIYDSFHSSSYSYIPTQPKKFTQTEIIKPHV